MSEEHHALGTVVAGEEAVLLLGREPPDRALRPKDSVPEGMAVEDLVLELVEDQFARAILVGVQLVDDDLALLGPLLVGEAAVAGDVQQHLEAPLAVGRGEEGVEHRLLLGRVGIELCTHRLHALDDLRGRA